MGSRSVKVDGQNLRVDPASVQLKKRRLSSLAFLSELADELTELTLIDNGLTSLRDLPPLPKLRKLTVAKNEVTGLRGLERAPALEELSLGQTPVRELPALPRLRLLMLDTAGKNLGFLAQVPAVEYLGVSGALDSLEGLHHAPRLGELIIDGAPLTRLEAISHQALWKLFVSKSQLQRVPRLETPSLLILGLSENAITDTSALHSLPALRDVHLSRNPLAQLSGCTALPALELLDLDLRRLKSVDAQTDAALTARPPRVGRQSWTVVRKKLGVIP